MDLDGCLVVVQTGSNGAFDANLMTGATEALHVLDGDVIQYIDQIIDITFKMDDFGVCLSAALVVIRDLDVVDVTRMGRIKTNKINCVKRTAYAPPKPRSIK